jgi:Rad3-related DNA helicase
MTTKGIAARSERLGVVIYATPTHKLNTRIDDQFIGHGITARVFRGREAADPENKGKQMCLNLEAVELAQEIGAGITETCCKKGEKTCKYIGQCGYYRQQQNAEDVRVWIIAHSMLFHYHRVFGEPVAVIIDEGFWGAGLRGIRKDDKCVLSLSSIDKNTDNIELILRETLSDARETLSDALEQQKDDGGVERQNLLDNRVTAEQCRKAIKLEWSCLPRITIEPGMSKKQIQRLGIDAAAIKHGRRMIRIWREVRDLLEDDAITTSGRLTLLQEEGVRWRG